MLTKPITKLQTMKEQYTSVSKPGNKAAILTSEPSMDGPPKKRTGSPRDWKFGEYVPSLKSSRGKILEATVGARMEKVISLLEALPEALKKRDTSVRIP